MKNIIVLVLLVFLEFKVVAQSTILMINPDTINTFCYQGHFKYYFYDTIPSDTTVSIPGGNTFEGDCFTLDGLQFDSTYVLFYFRFTHRMNLYPGSIISRQTIIKPY